jgi:hypothetical protein
MSLLACVVGHDTNAFRKAVQKCCKVWRWYKTTSLATQKYFLAFAKAFKPEVLFKKYRTKKVKAKKIEDLLQEDD